MGADWWGWDWPLEAAGAGAGAVVVVVVVLVRVADRALALEGLSLTVEAVSSTIAAKRSLSTPV